jgi:glycine cleavage system aminomethyltransferase T
MGYVATPFTKEGSEIFISTGGKKIPATVTKPPFYKG